MNLLIDSISSFGSLILFDMNKHICDHYSWPIQGKESSTLIPKIDEFLSKNSLKYTQLQNLVVVNGPGSFTGVRTSVLVANTINFIIKKNIIPVSYFDLFDDYPIVKTSSKRDCFVLWDQKSDIEILKNDILIQKLQTHNIQKIYGEFNKDFLKEIKRVDKLNYENIINKIPIDNTTKVRRIDPLYIKKPNIS